jgi:hypothetical protein
MTAPPASAHAPSARESSRFPATATTPPASGVLEGCTARSAAGVGWRYDCGGLLAGLIDAPIDIPRDSLAEGAINGFRSSLAGDFNDVSTEYDVAGHRVRGHRVIVTRQGAIVMRGDIVAMGVDGHGSRLLTCFGSAVTAPPERCSALFDAMALSPWRGDAAPGSRVEVFTPVLAGRILDVPKGCAAAAQDNGGMLQCEGAPVLWWLVNPADPVGVQDRFFGNLGGVPSRVPCTIDSVATECRHAGDAKNGAYSGHAMVRGQSVVVFCLTPGNKVPAACAQVFRVAAEQ